MNEVNKSALTTICENIGETHSGLTGSEIIKICNNFATKYSVIIPFTSVDQLRTDTKERRAGNKRTALLENLKEFDGYQQFEILKHICEESRFKDNPKIDEVKELLYTNYSDFNNSKLSDKPYVKRTKELLSPFQSIFEIFNKAIQDYDMGRKDRNILDDMRFILEQLVKLILESNKISIEHNKEVLGQYLKNLNISKEIRNIFTCSLTQYCSYQNDNVKHSDNINPLEVEFLIELTCTFINFLVKANNEK